MRFRDEIITVNDLQSVDSCARDLTLAMQYYTPEQQMMAVAAIYLSMTEAAGVEERRPLQLIRNLRVSREIIPGLKVAHIYVMNEWRTYEYEPKVQELINLRRESIEL